MPVRVSHPGVYVEEVPSGVRTITGVATSVTAFVGRAKRGPAHRAVEINSFGDFERIFGGLALDSPLSYAVRDFYLNGGSDAVIVRLFHSAARDAAEATARAGDCGGDVAAVVKNIEDEASKYTSEPAKSAAAKVVKAAQGVAGQGDVSVVRQAAGAAAAETPTEQARVTVGGLKLAAASEGLWGANLRAVVDKDDLSDDVAAALGVAEGDLFNLTVRDAGAGGATEKFLNLTVRESARRADRVLANESQLVRWDGTLDPDNPPNVSAAADPVTDAERRLAAKKKVVEDKRNAGQTPTAQEKQAVSDAKAALDKARQEFRDTVSDGAGLRVGDFLPPDGLDQKRGLYALEQADLFNLLCIPPYTATGDVDADLWAAAAAYCEKRRAFLIVDPPSAWRDKSKAAEEFRASGVGARTRNGALYFPRVIEADPLRDNQLGEFVPSGAVAGLMARTDAARGVWKAPAGTEATLVGVQGLTVNLTNAENGELNSLGINCLRAFPVIGRVAWGARTLRGADRLGDEYKYIPVRRLALFIEESTYRGLKWAVFEPNDEPLWAQIRLNVGAFLNNLFRQGAFQGTTPREAYFVKCDKETTTQCDINLGVVNVLVGFAPLKPAEFVIIKLQQMAGQIETKE